MTTQPDYQGEDSLAQSMMDTESEDPEGMLVFDERGNVLSRPIYGAQEIPVAVDE